MLIHFGLHHDGQRGEPAVNTQGELTLGPAGLLALLEMHLGLGGPEPQAAERGVVYRECLARRDRPERFYHRSFAVNSLGVAAHLLGWRDAFYLHGWTGGPFAGDAPRLRDLAEVEAVAADRLPPGPGERLQAVAAALRRRRVPIAAVALLDPLAAFPATWQAVLRRLPVHEPAPLPAAGAGRGFLGRLQTRLLQAQPAPLPWQDDGTVCVVRAETPLLAGRWLAGRPDAGDTLLVAPDEGEWLDDLLAAAGRPRPGLSDPSPGRPGLQMLPLALELLWDPLDVPALMALLTHPVSPLPAYARAILARELAERPGIGGPGWLEALARVEACFVRESAARADPIRQRIAYWLEPDRQPPGEGADLQAVIERVERLAGYCRRRWPEADPAPREAFAAALGSMPGAERRAGRAGGAGGQGHPPPQSSGGSSASRTCPCPIPGPAPKGGCCTPPALLCPAWPRGSNGMPAAGCGRCWPRGNRSP